MIRVDCSELSADEKLALASQISDRLEGVAVALVKDEYIVLDALTAEKPEQSVVKEAISDFISRRRDGTHYSLEVLGERIVVHSADPVAAMRGKEQSTLPPNLKQCPFCGFITPSDELLMLHVRVHGKV